VTYQVEAEININIVTNNLGEPGQLSQYSA